MAGADPPLHQMRDVLHNSSAQAVTWDAQMFNAQVADFIPPDNSTTAITTGDIGNLYFADGGTAGNFTFTVTTSNTITLDDAFALSRYSFDTGNGWVMIQSPKPKPWVRAYNKLKWWAGWYERRRDRITRERNNAERERERIEAEAKARSLLEELFELVPGEKFIRVLSEKFDNREYRIPLDGDLPQVWIDGKLDHKICISTSYSFRLPKSDVAAARALLVSTSEEEFLKIGNRVRQF